MTELVLGPMQRIVITKSPVSNPFTAQGMVWAYEQVRAISPAAAGTIAPTAGFLSLTLPKSVSLDDLRDRLGENFIIEARVSGSQPIRQIITQILDDIGLATSILDAAQSNG